MNQLGSCKFCYFLCSVSWALAAFSFVILCKGSWHRDTWAALHLPPMLSGGLPVWIHLPAMQLPWKALALLKVHVKLRLQSAKSVVRRRGLGPGGAADPLLWVQREVPNSCGSQGRFRGRFGKKKRGGMEGHTATQSNLKNQVALFYFTSTFFREIYTP